MTQIELQSIITIAGILLTAVLAYYFSQRRYTFEKLYDRKFAYLENIYGKIISLEKDLKKYIYTTGAEMKNESLPKKREEISVIQKKFFELQEFFWKKEIVLDESSVTAVQSFIDTSISILAKLKTSLVSQGINDPATSSRLWDEAYQVMNDKLSSAKDELKKDFRIVINK